MVRQRCQPDALVREANVREIKRRHWTKVSLLGLLAAGIWAPSAAAQLQTQNPPTLDDQLRRFLSLGDGAGCTTLRNGQSLTAFEASVGNELKAICGPSAVGSASSLGGAINSSQATKTVSQFKIARRRLDQRLRPRPSSGSGSGGQRRSDNDWVQFAAIQAQTMSDAPLGYSGSREDTGTGLGVFGEFEFEQRERESTLRETGYDVDGAGGTFGFDWAGESTAAGVWVRYTDEDGDYLGGAPLIANGASTVAPGAAAVLSNPSVLDSLCGGATGGGEIGFEEFGGGGFFGMRFGGSAFADVSISYANRDMTYARDACAIEIPSTTIDPVAFDGGFLFIDSDRDGRLDRAFDPIANTGAEAITDDIFAGRISGATSSAQYSASVRSGFDMEFGGLVIGPRASLSFSRTEIDGYTETGVNSLTAPTVVIPGSSTIEDRTTCLALWAADTAATPDPTCGYLLRPGAPTGLEMSYSDRSYDSLQIEAGAEISYAFDFGGWALVPFGSAYWRHEFQDDFQTATARMAEDTRGANAFFFDFAYDPLSSDSATISAGVAAMLGEKAMARLEVSRLVADDFFDATSLAASFRIRF